MVEEKKVKKNVKNNSLKSTVKSKKVVKDKKKSKVKDNVKTVKEDSFSGVVDKDYLYPSVNIGLVGHVDHGKTTLTQRLSGKWTDTHSEELKRGITIRLGYADVTFYKIPGKEGFEAYTTDEKTDGMKNKVLRKVSFVDAPGHESLMATMLAGAALMDGALLLIAANEKCPQPQTREHLMALEIIGIKNVIVVQNKIDLVSKERALENYNEIKSFLKGTSYENAPIIPISAQQGININVLIYAIEKFIPIPNRDFNKDPLMFVARSFDVNKPGTKIDELQGGVLGGTVVQGEFKIGDEVEIVPGRKVSEKGKIFWKPIRTKIVGLKAGNVEVDKIIPGGSVGVMTSLDPSIVRSDYLSGNVVGKPGKTPTVQYNLKLKVELLDRVVGSKEDLVVEPIKEREPLVLNVNSATSVGLVNKISKGSVEIILKIPVAAFKGSKVTISRRFKDRWRLIGYGIIE